MKLFKFPDCIDVHVSMNASGRLESRASLMLHAIAIDGDPPADITDSGAALAALDASERAAESVLAAAGLRAAVYFGADILPFIQLGQQFKRGDQIGTVTAVINVPNEEHVGIHWHGSDLDAYAPTDPDDIADDLRAGVMVLA